MGKLLKHEFLYYKRLAIPYAIVLLILSAVTGLVQCLLSAYLESDITAVGPNFFAICATLLLPFLYLFLLSGFYVAPILSLVRYHKSIFTDEGYLTMVLPVKTGTLLGSKFLGTTLFSLVSMTYTALCFLIVFLVSGQSFDDYTFLFENFSTVDMLLASLISMIGMLLILFFIITFCNTVVRRHKVLLGIVLYFTSSSILSILSVLLSDIFMTFIPMDSLPIDLALSYSTSMYSWISAGVAAVAAVGSTVATYYLIKKKFNLT